MINDMLCVPKWPGVVYELCVFYRDDLVALPAVPAKLVHNISLSKIGEIPQRIDP